MTPAKARDPRGKFFPTGKSCLTASAGTQKYINKINIL
jgi:hypothetical protein